MQQLDPNDHKELSKQFSICVNNVTPLFDSVKINIAEKYPKLVTRNGLSKSHVVKSNFKKDFIVKHQKGWRIPINIKDEVSAELKRLIEIGRVEKFNSCSEEHFFLLS